MQEARRKRNAEKIELEGDIRLVSKWRNVGKSQSDVILIDKDDKISMCKVKVTSGPKAVVAGGRRYKLVNFSTGVRSSRLLTVRQPTQLTACCERG